MGLLLLRAAVGLTAVIQGGFFLTDRGNQTLTNWVIGLTAVASGALLGLRYEAVHLAPIDFPHR